MLLPQGPAEDEHFVTSQVSPRTARVGGGRLLVTSSPFTCYRCMLQHTRDESQDDLEGGDKRKTAHDCKRSARTDGLKVNVDSELIYLFI